MLALLPDFFLPLPSLLLPPDVNHQTQQTQWEPPTDTGGAAPPPSYYPSQAKVANNPQALPRASPVNTLGVQADHQVRNTGSRADAAVCIMIIAVYFYGFSGLEKALSRRPYKPVPYTAAGISSAVDLRARHG